LTISIVELVKNGGVGVLSITSSIHSILSILTKFEPQGKNKATEKKGIKTKK